VIIAKQIEYLGGKTLNLVARIGCAGSFLLRTICRRPRFKQGVELIAQQIYQEGVLSLAIVLLSAVFIGMVLALQGYHTLHKFGAETEVGQLLALSVTRELGPVVTALLFAGRAGSALTAEIGLMQATNQLSCMKMMAVDPLWRVISPRFWAGFISLPVLTILFNLVAIYGGHWVAVDWLGVSNGTFWNNMQASVDFQLDVINGVIKSIVFGFVVTWIAVYQGYYTKPNAAGIARATTRTVVYASLMVLALDFILTSMMIGEW
jgi:phospholipid/cholesterol/gamma-HCH transport system permease protein